MTPSCVKLLYCTMYKYQPGNNYITTGLHDTILCTTIVQLCYLMSTSVKLWYNYRMLQIYQPVYNYVTTTVHCMMPTWVLLKYLRYYYSTTIIHDATLGTTILQ